MRSRLVDTTSRRTTSSILSFSRCMYIAQRTNYLLVCLERKPIKACSIFRCEKNSVFESMEWILLLLLLVLGAIEMFVVSNCACVLTCLRESLSMSVHITIIKI